MILHLVFICALLSVEPAAYAQKKSGQSIDPKTLGEEVTQRLSRVEQFRFIKEEAEKLGVRVWLFGGTASSFVHYVKWDLQRESGDTRFQADRFDYDFASIYRTNQDMDLAVDGSQEKIQALKATLRSQFPYFLGLKTQWDLRSLKESTGIAGQPGYQEGLLNDFDFLNQHTDSQSTGIIEITDAPDVIGALKAALNEHRIRDLRDLNSYPSQFLNDAAKGMITYYYSPRHAETSRSRAGNNPEIFSVVRALVKAFQFDLKFHPEQYQILKKVAQEFRPDDIHQHPDNLRRLKDMSVKLIKHAVSIEAAVNTLEDLGLRKKLSAFDSPGTPGSLAWWMEREPLRGFKIGSIQEAKRSLEKSGLKDVRPFEGGKTAKELGIDLVAHTTGDFLAYESITRAHTGDANVLISRASKPGETAIVGDGFYTNRGRIGGKKAGLTIRFRVHPDAREGIDFFRTNDVLIFLNKNALRVLPESLSMGLVEYFETLRKGDIADEDRALFARLRRKLQYKAHHLSNDEVKRLEAIVEVELTKTLESQRFIWPEVLNEYFALPAAARRLDFVERLIDSKIYDVALVQKVLSNPAFAKHTYLYEKLIRTGRIGGSLLGKILNYEWIHEAGPLERFASEGNLDWEIAAHFLPQVKPNPRFRKVASQIIQRGRADGPIVQLLALAWDEPSLVEELIERGGADSDVVQFILSQRHYPHLVRKLVERRSVTRDIVTFVLSSPHAHDLEDVIWHLIWTEDLDHQLIRFPLKEKHWIDRPDFIEAILEKGGADISVAEFYLTRPDSAQYPHILEKLILKETADRQIRSSVLNRKHWRDNPWLRQITGGNVTLENLRKAFHEGHSFQKDSGAGGGQCGGLFSKD